MSSDDNGTIGIKERKFITEDNKSVYFGINGEAIKINAVPKQGTATEVYKLKSLVVAKPDGEVVYKFDRKYRARIYRAGQQPYCYSPVRTSGNCNN